MIDKIKDVCKKNPQTILFAEANDFRIIKAARYLKDNEFARPVFIGGGFEIREMAEEMDISSKGLQIINHRHQKEFYPFVEQLKKKIRYRDNSKKDLEILLNNELFYSLVRLDFGKADLVIAGNTSTMRIVAKMAIDVLGICDNYKRASSFYVLISPDYKNTFIFADCSININPSAATLAEIAIKTAEKYLMITDQVPRVAFLSFSTKGSAQPGNLDKIREAIKIVNKTKPSLICDGEIQFDAAMDQFVAEKKGAKNILNGKANVFIFPTLDSANIGQKIAEQIAGYLSIGPMIQGLKKNIHHLPKSCTVENIINSALLASFLKIKS
jgi:phosphotransacetylase